MLLLVCVAIVIYLASVGIPRFVLDKLEEAAREQGLELRIDSARLGYGSGLSFILRDVRVDAADKTNKVPSIELGRLRVGLRVSPLLQGQVRPYLIRIRRSQITFYSDKIDSGSLSLKDINITCTVNHRDVMQIVSSSPMDADGMKLSFKAELPINDTAQQQPTVKTEVPILGDLLGAWVSAYQDKIDGVCAILEEQAWKPEDKPRLNLSFNAIKTPRCNFEIELPTVCYDDVRFKDVSLNGVFSNDTLLIHHLELKSAADEKLVDHLSNHEAKAVLQGGYNIATRKLSFTLDSNMPLLSIASGMLKPEDFKLVERISLSSKERSEIQLQGDLQFGEAYELQEASILGYLMQKNIHIDRTQIDEMVLSFYFKDGNFAIDQAHIKIGDGYVSTQSHLNHGQGHIELNASLSLKQMSMLAESLVSEGTEIELPENLSIDQPVKLHAVAKMIDPDFQRGQVALKEFLPEVDSLEITLAIPEMKYEGLRLSQGELVASVGKLHAFDLTQLQLAEQVKLKISAEEVQFEAQAIDADPEDASLNEQMSEGLEAVQMNKHQKLAHFVLDLDLAQVKYQEISEEGQRSGLSLEDLNLKASVQGLEGKDLKLEQLDVQISDLKKLEVDKPKEADLSNCRVDVDASKLLYKGESIVNLELDTRFSNLEEFKTELCCTIDEEAGQSVQLSVDKLGDGAIHLHDLKADIPSSLLNVLLPQDVLEAWGLSFPSQVVHLNGSSELKLDEDSLDFVEGSYQVHIPRLARRGVHVLPHADVINEMDVKAKLHIYRGGDGAYLFDSPHFSLSKGERSLTGSLVCQERGVLKFKVESNLLLDTLDELIDDHLTHLIMRDFRGGDDSDVDIRELDLTVDVREGLDVQATGKIELVNIMAMLGSYERVPDPEGVLNQEDILSKEASKQLRTKILHGQADVVVDVHLDPAPEGEVRRELTKSLISINNVSLTFDNRPWLRHKKIKGGTNESTLHARSVVLDTKNNFVSIHEAKGGIYPDYAIGTFFSPLRDFLKVLELRKPVDVESHYCIFPISLDSKVEMDGSIAMKSRPNFVLKLVGMKFPLERFSGFIDFRKGGVYLDRLNAIFCEGVANGCILLTTGGKSTGYDGQLNLKSCNFKNLAALVDNAQSRALVNASIRFRAKDMETESLQAYGSMEILDGDLMKMRIFAPISDMITNLPNLIDKQEELINSGKLIPRKLTFYEKASSKLKAGTAAVVGVFTKGIGLVTSAFGQTTSNLPGANYLLNYNLRNASADFVIGDGVLSSNNLRATGSNMAVSSSLHIDLKRMYLQANLWPEMSSVLSLMLSPITVLSNGIIDIKVYGTMDDLGWKIVFNPWSESQQDVHANFKLSADRHFEEVERNQKKKE